MAWGQQDLLLLRVERECLEVDPAENVHLEEGPFLSPAFLRSQCLLLRVLLVPALGQCLLPRVLLIPAVLEETMLPA